MGKPSKEKIHHQQQQNLDPENPGSSQSTGRSCSSTLSRLFGLRCIIVLVISFAVLLSAIFWLFPRRSLSHSDAHEIAKLNASVQAYFRLHKPASEVMSQKGRLEHDLFQSIGLSNTKVTILSLHQSGASNYTDVKFAVLPVSPDHAIEKHSLSLLRSSFVKLFAQRSKLNLTTSSFGQPTSFQVLKFPGGITVDLLGSKPASGVPEIICTLTLQISISQIQDSLAQLNGQLDHELCLEPYDESVYFQFKNEQGSTISPPVTVNVVSTTRNHLQQRLDHFSQIIQTSRAKNLGLDNTVFGAAKSITCLNYLDGKILDSASVFAPEPTSCVPSLC